MSSEGRYRGPGGVGVLKYQSFSTGQDKMVMTFSYSDAEEGGLPQLAARELSIDADGWPVLASEPWDVCDLHGCVVSNETPAPVSPTLAPVTPLPTTATPSLVPTRAELTPAPNTGYPPCFICGDPDASITKPDAIVESAFLDPIPCSTLDLLARSSFLDPDICSATLFISISVCGCRAAPTMAPIDAPTAPVTPFPTPVYTPAPNTGYLPCFICGREESVATNSGGRVETVSLSSTPCSVLDTVGRNGQIAEDVCAEILPVADVECGCSGPPTNEPSSLPSIAPVPTTPGPTLVPTTLGPQYTPAPNTGFLPCFICGDEDANMSNPGGIIETPSLEAVSCQILDIFGRIGQVDEEICIEAQAVAKDACGCADPPSAAPVTPVPSAAPVTPVPSAAPVTPVPSGAPTQGPPVFVNSRMHGAMTYSILDRSPGTNRKK